MKYNAYTDSFDSPLTASNLTSDNARNGNDIANQVGNGGHTITFTREDISDQHPNRACLAEEERV